MDCEHFRARLETAQADCMREKKVDLLPGYSYLCVSVLITEAVMIKLSFSCHKMNPRSKNQFGISIQSIIHIPINMLK